MNDLGTGPGTVLNAVLTKATNAMISVSQIPTGAAGGNDITLSYGTPLNGDMNMTTGITPSNFPSILGSVGSASGMINGAFQALNASKIVVNTIGTAADGFVSSISTFQAAIASVQTQISNFTTFLNDTNNNLESTLLLITNPSDMVTIGVQAFYGVVIGFSIFALIGVILMTCCDKFKCRYLMYFACLILFIIGLIGFIIAVVYSILVPVLYFGCQFMDFSLASKTNFDSNFQTLLSDATFRGYITSCLPTENGDILTLIGGGTTAALTNLSSVMTNINIYNSTA
eukprot:GHVR01042376.1.p1 GENE.GHVR01042376.1~~GHVR01042376.1.p1  ORF type:complete len:286 (+),score=5.96 GHVR01042376.1:756-1613(+)